MDTKPTDTAGEEGSSAALSAEEFESWTLVDRSPKAGHLKMKPGVPKEEPVDNNDDEEVEDEEDEEVSDKEDEESGSSEGEVDEDDEDEDQSGKPSGVEPVKNKPKQTKRELGDVSEARDKENRDDDRASSKKEHAGRNIDPHSHDGSSSDGISVISESDGSDHARLHMNKHFLIDQLQQSSVQLTPPLSPEQDDEKSTEERSKRNRQLKRKRSREDDVDNALVPDDAIVPWRHVNRTSFVIFSIVLTGIAAILVGNSRMYENRTTINSFDHEKRLSELELENTILKNEMNKLKHLYTRSELDEQVQQAEFEWMQAMDHEMQDQSPTEPEPQPEPEPSTSAPEPEPEQPQMRRVPPHDDNIRHRVVWSGDDGQPMLIADKDYVLPEFCYNKNAVQDELFSEYSSKYCDSKQRKIDAKLKKSEHNAGKHKYKHPRDYKQYIHPTAEEVAEHQKQATAPPPKVPSLSPFDFDYRSAFETIKEEGSVILQSLTAILDLDPEPELLPPILSEGYLADDEASSSTSASSVGSAPSQNSEQPSTSPESINWADYPPWVREKYENQPDMYRKLQNKAALLWEWERKKNQFLDEVGLSTLEEVDRKTEDELRQRRDQYEKEHPRDRRQLGERNSEEQRKYEKDNERKTKEGKYDERKDYRPRNGDSRSHERKDYRKEDHKEWKVKENRNGDKSRESYEKQRGGDQRQSDFKRPSTSREGSGQKQHYKDNENDSGESREVSSGDRDPRYKHNHDYRKNGEHNKYHKDSDEWKKDYKKNGDHHPKRRDSDERDASGEGSHSKFHHQDEHKKAYKSKEEYHHHDRKYDEKKPYHDRRRDDGDDDDDDDDDDDHYKRRHHDKHHRNGDDYRKQEQKDKEWHDKRHHKHKKGDHWNKHEDKKWHDREHHHQSKERRR